MCFPLPDNVTPLQSFTNHHEWRCDGEATLYQLAVTRPPVLVFFKTVSTHTRTVAMYVCQRLLFLKQANHKHQSATTQQCVLKPFIRHVHFSPSCDSSSEHLSPPLRLNGSHFPNACETLLISYLFLDACHYAVCAAMSCDYDTACRSSERADKLLISLFFFFFFFISVLCIHFYFIIFCEQKHNFTYQKFLILFHLSKRFSSRSIVICQYIFNIFWLC